MSDIGDTVGIGIRLEDDGSAGQYAKNLEDLITRAITNAGDALASKLKDALASAGADFAKTFTNSAKVAQGSISGIADQTNDLQDRLQNATQTAERFASELGVDPDLFDGLVQSTQQLQELFDVLADSGRDLNALDLRRLRGEFENLRRVSIEQLAQFQTVQSTIRTGLKAESDERRQASRERIATLKAESGLEIVQLQTSSAQQVAQLKASTQERVALIQQETKRRVELFKLASNAIVALERGLRSVFENTAKAVSAGFRGLASVAQTSANTIQSVFRRSNQRVVDDYGRSLRTQEQQLQNSVNEQTKTIRRFADESANVLSQIGVGRAAGLGAVAAAGAFLGRSLQAGFNRFATLQEATRGLNLLLQDATESARLLDGVLDVVRGTPFGLELFADAAAQLVTFNVRAKEIPPLLAAIGDASALKGTRAPEFIGRLVNIFGRISAQARVTGEDLARLQEAGVPALQILGNQLNKTVLEIRDLVSSGQVGREAIEQLARGISEGTDGINGATVAFAGLAKSLGTTLRGAIANLGAARARLGAAIIGPFNDAFIAVVGLLTKLTDEVTRSISNLLAAFSSGPFLTQFTAIVNRLSADLGSIFERIRPVAAAAVRTVLALGAAFAALSSVRFAARGVQLLNVALNGLVSPLRLLFAAATGVTFVITKLVRENLALNTAVGFLQESLLNVIRPLRAIFDSVTDSTSALRRAFTDLFQGGFAVLSAFATNVLAPALVGIGLALRNTVVPAVENFTERITTFIQSDAGARLSALFTSVVAGATQFAEFVVTRVVPALARFAAIVGGVVFVAVERFVSLIRDRVLPVLTRVVDRLREFVTTIGTQVPEAVRNFGRAISEAFSARSFGGVANAFREFLLGLGPIAAVAGAAVALRFVNPFLGLGVLVAGGLAVAFGPQLLQQIQPRLNDLRERIRAAFSFDALLGFSVNVLALVNRLGRALGRVVSDPRLVAAVAGIAAVGVALAGSFILGVIQGISDNIPDLIRGIQDLIGKAIFEGFRAALTDPLIAVALITGFAALIAGPTVIANLRRNSAFAANVVAQNFTNGVRNAVATTQPLPGGASTFLQGLFGGPAALTAAAKAQAQQVQQIVTRETQRQFRTAQALGLTQGPGRGSAQSAAQIGQAIQQVQAEIGAIGVAGAVARNSIQRLSQEFVQLAIAARTSGGAIAGSLRNLNFRAATAGARDFGQTLTVALGRARIALSDLANSLRVAAPALFARAGAVAGSAFATAFSAQSLFDPNATGGDRAGGILGIVATFGATAAIAGPQVAALATGIGVLAGAFQSAGARAREAEQRIVDLSKILRGFEDPRGAQAIEAAFDRIIEALSPDEIQAVAAAGLDIGDFIDLATGDIRELQNLVNLAERSLPEGGVLGFVGRIIGSGTAEAAQAAALQDLANALNVSTENAEELANVIIRLGEVIDAQEIADLQTEITGRGELREFLNNLKTGVQEFAQSLLDAGLPLDEVRRRISQLERGVPAVVGEFNKFTAGLIAAGQAPLEFVNELRELSQLRLEGLRNELDDFRAGLELADETIDATRENIKRLLSGDEIDSAQLVDASIIAVRRIGESIESSLGKPGEAARAELRGYLRDARDTAAELLSQGIEESIVTGVQFTAADAAGLLQPLLTAANEIGGPAGEAISEQLKFVLEGFEFPPVQALIDERRSLEEAQDFGDRASEQIQLAIDAEIKFDQALVRDGAADAARAAFAGIVDLEPLFNEAGISIVDGVIVGITDQTPALKTSLENLLLTGLEAGKASLGIQSPSTVAAAEIGVPIAQGIAAGIEAGSPLVGSVLENLRARVIAVGQSLIGGEFTSGLSIAQSGTQTFRESVEASAAAVSKLSDTQREYDTASLLDKLQSVGDKARGASRGVQELDLAINDLQRSLLQEFDIFNFLPTEPFREVTFDDARKALNDLLTSIGGVADRFAKGLRDGTIAGVAQAANAFGEFEQKVIEGIREGIVEGSIQGVDDVNRTLDLIGVVVAEQLGPKNQAAIDEFDRLIGGLRDRADIEALIIVELEQRALREAEEKLAELNAQISRLGDLTSRVFRGLLTQLDNQFDQAQRSLSGLFDRVFDRAQLPTGPLGLPDIGVIEDYAQQASDALTGIFDRLLGRNQLATEAVTGDLDELIAARADAVGRISAGESLIEQLRAESVEIENELRQLGGGLAESFRTFFERGAAGEGAFRAQARAIGLSAAEVEDLIAKQRQLRVAQRDIAAAQLLEAENSEKIAEERERLRTANIELLESSIALLDNGVEGARIFQEIADAAGLTQAEVGDLREAYRRLQFEEQQEEVRRLAEQDQKLREANQDLLESSLALIDAGPDGVRTFREIGRAAGVSELEIQQLINEYRNLRAIEEQQIALDLALQQLELESAVRDSALALQELIDLGPEGSDFFNRLAELSGLNVESARDLILEYGNIVAENSGEPPATLFEGLREFTNSNVEIAQVLLDKYGNVVSTADQDAPTRFFASLDGQIDRTASKIAGVSGSLANLRAGLAEAEAAQATIAAGFAALGDLSPEALAARGVISNQQLGAAVNIQNATFQTPSDADRVAQATIAAVNARIR